VTAYLIGRMSITDQEAYAEYKKRTPEILARYGGRFLTRGGMKLTLEGPEEGRRIVVAEFPSVEQARAFYYSPEYQDAAALRRQAAEMQLMIIEGFE
jgi:uncharacterized protein (DUF1330 family)